MNRDKKKREHRGRRRARVRARVTGTATRPRLSVFRSMKHLFVQLIDDEKAQTLCSVSDREIQEIEGAKDGVEAGQKVQRASAVGKLLAARALEKGISAVVFDRGGYAYHGRVKAIAEGARLGGLKF